MSFNRLPGAPWLTRSRLFPRRYGCRHRPFVHPCNCRRRNPVPLRVNMLETRESPTSFGLPESAVLASGQVSMTSLATEHSSALADATWHSPPSENSFPVGRISNPSHETSVLPAIGPDRSDSRTLERERRNCRRSGAYAPPPYVR